MAGDWLPMRIDLHDEAEVIGIALAVKLDEFSVVGRLLRLWGWASSRTQDGWIPFVTPEKVDQIVQRSGFAAATAKVGWLSFHDDGITIPNFSRWMSESSKKRLDDARRKRASRSKNDSSVDVTNLSQTTVTSSSLLSCPVLCSETSNVGNGRVPPHPSIDPFAPKTPDDGFAEFWAAYPCKVKKVEAARSWARLKPSAELQARILAAIEVQKRWEKWTKEQGQFIPQPANWLEGRQWEDEGIIVSKKKSTADQVRELEQADKQRSGK